MQYYYVFKNKFLLETMISVGQRRTISLGLQGHRFLRLLQNANNDTVIDTELI